jgi:hypothetical protein
MSSRRLFSSSQIYLKYPSYEKLIEKWDEIF